MQRLLNRAIAVVILVAASLAAQDRRSAPVERLVKEYVERMRQTRFDPDAIVLAPTQPFTEAEAEEHAAWFEQFVRRVARIDPARLSNDEWVTWSLLRWEGEVGSARRAFFWHEIPVTPYSSPLRSMQAFFHSAPLVTEADREKALERLRRIPGIVKLIEAKLRTQVDRGIVLPAGEVDLVVPHLRAFTAGAEAGGFGVPQARLDTIPPGARDAFASAVRNVVTSGIVPVVDRLAAYVDGPYRARARSEVGVRRYPSGAEYYRYLIRVHTGLPLSPERIHEIGLEEVARLERALDEVRRAVAFGGSLAEFRTFLETDARFFPKTPEEIGTLLTRAAERIEPRIDQWFLARPKAPYGARRLSPALEPAMTYGYYQVPTAADPKGYYLFNGSKLEERSILNVAALSYHELVPGHHFQIALARENPRLDAFRRGAQYTAFVEGWGEYASDLAGEMGMYDDPYAKAGRLAMDLFLSTRLVVDTGMNALGWTRERSMQYMRDHTFESETQIATETLRYSSDMPGQALAYKLGSHTIRELRETMRGKLGSEFDVRRFHEAVLGYGAMPLGVLQEHVARTLGASR